MGTWGNMNVTEKKTFIAQTLRFFVWTLKYEIEDFLDKGDTIRGKSVYVSLAHTLYQIRIN